MEEEGGGAGTGRNDRSWTSFHSALVLGLIVGNDVGGEETPGRIHLFVFPSETRKEEVKRNNINHEDVRINQQRRHNIGRNSRSSLMAAAMAMATNRQSLVEGRPSLEAAAGATTDESPEARWLFERLVDGKCLIISQERLGLIISCARPGRKWGGGAYSGGGGGGYEKESCRKW